MPSNKEYHATYYIRNKEAVLLRNRKWKSENADLNREIGRKSERALRFRRRQEVLNLVGNKCARCSFSDTRALQIDHINGDGAQEAKLVKDRGAYYKKVIESLTKEEKKYQILCANCNWIKRHENNEHTKVKE